MKKEIFFLLMLFTLIFASCSNDGAIGTTGAEVASEESVQPSGLEDLRGKIVSVNDSLMLHGTMSRGWWNRFLRRIMADAVGAMFGNLYGGPAGAVIGAASFSVAAVANEYEANGQPDITQCIVRDVDLNANNYIPYTPNESTRNMLDSIGYYHNKAILEAYSQNKTISKDDLPKVLLEEVKKDMPYASDISHIDTLAINTKYKRFIAIDKQYKGENLFEYTKHLNKNYPRNKVEINIISDFVEGLACAKLQECPSDYTEVVLKIIDESDIPAVTKQDLRNGVIVGYASSKLWKIK